MIKSTHSRKLRGSQVVVMAFHVLVLLLSLPVVKACEAVDLSSQSSMNLRFTQNLDPGSIVRQRAIPTPSVLSAP